MNSNRGRGSSVVRRDKVGSGAVRRRLCIEVRVRFMIVVGVVVVVGVVGGVCLCVVHCS